MSTNRIPVEHSYPVVAGIIAGMRAAGPGWWYARTLTWRLTWPNPSLRFTLRVA